VELVERAEIDTQLHAAQNVSLVLFCAPAGFGKTTAMARYFDKQKSNGVVTVWILLDEADNDVERFLFKMQAALDTSGLFDDEMSAGTSGLRRPERGSTCRPAWHWRSSRSRSSSTISNCCATRSCWIFSRRPGKSAGPRQAVLGTREHSRLNVGRWRATGRMVEIGPASLRFSSAEARELLARKSGVSLPQRALDQLYDRTEGWVAALQLAALSLARHPIPARLPGVFRQQCGGCRLPPGDRDVGPFAIVAKLLIGHRHPGRAQC